MNVDRFISIGENIHCTRVYKIGGKFCKEIDNGNFVINYLSQDGTQKQLPVPEEFTSAPGWESGKVKHCAVAIWQGVYGSGDGQQAGIDYLQSLAKRQQEAGATYLDINVDEFSTDVAERVKLMAWTVDIAQQAATIPMSIDSSNTEILKAGLAACDQNRGRPMVNSVSLEREDAVAIAKQANAVVIASAAGADSLPESVEGRMENLGKIYDILKAEGFADDDIHFDPLVFPISTDGQNGVRFLNTIRAIREKYGNEVHVVAGLSNVSFGMPNRKLINQVYTWLAVDAGADGGIVDPMQINIDILNNLDTESEPFKLARALLEGSDDFGMEYITASRDGRLNS